MIPKVIHYCWFGGAPLPKLAIRCIDSWKKYCPDFKIIEWNESNYDINAYRYTKEAYEKKKFAFVSDVARLKIIHDNGGFYFDTDVEILRPIDDLTKHGAYFGISGIDPDLAYVNTGLGFGAQQGHHLLRTLLGDYATVNFVFPDGSLNETTCSVMNTKHFENIGFVRENRMQTMHDVTVYPSEWFSPKLLPAGKFAITPNTYSIHYYDASWLSGAKKIKSRAKRIFGIDFVRRVKKLTGDR